MKILCALTLILCFPFVSLAAPSCPAGGPYKSCALSCSDSNIKCGPTLCGGSAGGKNYTGVNNGGTCEFGAKSEVTTDKATPETLKTKN